MASQTWKTILRQILLRGNFLAGDAAAMATAYNASPITSAALTKNAAEYPLEAIADSILQAMTLIVSAVGANRESNYRGFFLHDSEPIETGELIPLTDADNRERFGLIRDFRDSETGDYLTHQPRSLVGIAGRSHARLSDGFFYYYTDDVRLWHTVPFAVCEMVSWSRTAEFAAITTTNNVSVCPLPDELLPALEIGALSFIFRDTFNAEQAILHWQKFAPELNRIAGKQIADLELPSKT